MANGNLTEYAIDRAYNIRRTVSMNSNSVSIITAGFTNCTETVPVGKAITNDVTSYKLKIGASFTGKSRFLPMKVYGLKIFEADELVKDYLPFYANGVAGLTNSLDATDILTSRTYIGSNLIPDGVRTNVVFEAGGNITDSDVEKEAYLEFDGVSSHAINTGLYMTKDTCVEVDFSLWSTTRNSGAGQDIFAYGSSSNSVYVRFGFEKTLQNFYYWFHDYDVSAKALGSAVNSRVPINHERLQFKLDGFNNKVMMTSNGNTLHDVDLYNAPRNLSDPNKRLWIGCSYSGTTRPALMKLYSCRVSEAGVPVRDFVPCTHGGQAGLYDLVNGVFYPHTGGKVCGAKCRGVEFQILPQPMRIAQSDGAGTLTCLAAGARSYEWYVDGQKIDNETSDSLTVEWTRKKPYTRIYSVVPVYAVFNETVRGEPASATVEMIPFGAIITIK
ncbi:MAG: hypothetical protein IJH50_10850 [Kiritimatiellae bacterium]|nr:hypothetical protein [Kiritimatiellia bacterium]